MSCFVCGITLKPWLKGIMLRPWLQKKTEIVHRRKRNGISTAHQNNEESDDEDEIRTVILLLDRDGLELKPNEKDISNLPIDSFKAFNSVFFKNEMKRESCWQMPKDIIQTDDLNAGKSSWKQVANGFLDKANVDYECEAHQCCYELLQAVSKENCDAFLVPRTIVAFRFKYGSEGFRVMSKVKDGLEKDNRGHSEKVMTSVPIDRFPLAATYEQVIIDFNKVKKSSISAFNTAEGSKGKLCNVASVAENETLSNSNTLGEEYSMSRLPIELLEKMLFMTDVKTSISLASTSRTMRNKILPCLDRIAHNDIINEYPWMLARSTAEKIKWERQIEIQRAKTGIQDVPWFVYMKMCQDQENEVMNHRRRVIDAATDLCELLRDDLSPYEKAIDRYLGHYTDENEKREQAVRLMFGTG